MAYAQISTADTLFEAHITAQGVASSGQFAPYMIGSWNHGRTTAKNSASLYVETLKPLKLGERFSWGAGVEADFGYHHSTRYGRFMPQTQTWGTERYTPAGARLQQLYATVKYRGVELLAGMKYSQSVIIDDALSSGNLVLSNNAAPVPGGKIGFVDFQNIPFTKGWAQIYGNVMYGKFADNHFLRTQYNRYNEHITTGALYTYKQIYFRSNPLKPFCATIGVEMASQFGGTTKAYNKGELVSATKNPQSLSTFIKMFAPSISGDGFAEGSSLGSWNLRANYRLRSGHTLSGYLQWLWEDGSSMAKRNKTDGLWGLQYTAPGKALLYSVVLEYIDLRDHSGPVHFAPGDYPGVNIPTEATGADDYYNNTSFNAHANFGQAIGTPFLLSPIYNLDGYPQFAFNRSRGFHAAATGFLHNVWQYTAKISYQHAGAAGRFDSLHSLHNTSVSLALNCTGAPWLKKFDLGLCAAYDHGTLRGNNFGMMLTATYNISITR